MSIATRVLKRFMSRIRQRGPIVFTAGIRKTGIPEVGFASTAEQVPGPIPTPYVSAKFACVVPAHWTIEDYARHTCSDRSHRHFSRTEYSDSLKHGLIDILREEDRRNRQKRVVRFVRMIPARGLSCSVGEYLVTALRDDFERDWALAMLAQIRMRSEGRAS